jgi:ketopantoate reductase
MLYQMTQDPMAQDQFHKGLSTIDLTLEATLHERGVVGGVVKHNAQGEETQFSVTVDGKTEIQVFTRQEIEDSAQAIDAPAAIKVRMLVSPFVR